MNKGNKLYEGKAKIIYETKDKNLVIQHFKDDATAFNNLKKAKVEGKGVLNNRISESGIGKNDHLRQARQADSAERQKTDARGGRPAAPRGDTAAARARRTA